MYILLFKFMEDLILMEKDLVCEITEYMDKFIDPK